MNWTKQWEKERRKLKVEFEEKGITTCELRFNGCWRDNALSFAHRHKRDWYKTRGKEHLLGDFREVILACIPCHNKIEDDMGLTESVFNTLRYAIRPSSIPREERGEVQSVRLQAYDIEGTEADQEEDAQNTKTTRKGTRV